MIDPVTISMLVSGGVGLVQSYRANADQKKAEKDAQRLGAQLRQIQEADKVGGLQVPTLGAELARQSVGQQMAMAVNALTGAGAAGVLGGIPGAIAMSSNAALEIAADLQRQQAERDRFVAKAQQELETRRTEAERGMVEDQLVGAQELANAKGMERDAAAASAVTALGGAVASEIGARDLFKKKKKKELSELNEGLTGKQLAITVSGPAMSRPDVKQVTFNQPQQAPKRPLSDFDIQDENAELIMASGRRPSSMWNIPGTQQGLGGLNIN
jgi:hypothetical protein